MKEHAIPNDCGRLGTFELEHNMETNTFQNRSFKVGDKVLLRVSEAAALLGIGRSHLYRLMSCGEVRYLKIGRSTRVPWSAIDEFVERREIQPIQGLAETPEEGMR